MLFLRFLLSVLFFSTVFGEKYNDIDLALIHSCKTNFEENIDSYIKQNTQYKELLEKTGLKNSNAANKGLIIFLSESYDENPYLTAAELYKNCKKDFDSLREKYNDLNFTIENTLQDTLKIKEINFWITFFRTKSLVLFNQSKNTKLKKIYDTTATKISDIRKNKQK
jgi:hypothetical protein